MNFFTHLLIPRWHWRYSSINTDEILDSHLKLETAFSSPEFQNKIDNSTSRSILAFIVGFLLATSCSLGSVLIYHYTHSEAKPVLSSPLPEFPTEEHTITRSPAFEAPASPSSDGLWASGISSGLFVLIPEAEHYKLPPGMPTQNGSIAYGLAWTHEYHCLMMIRHEFWQLIRGTSSLYHDSGAERTLSPKAFRRVHHLAHCMDYIRQLIVCNADMTVEWRAKYPASNGNPYHIDGYGVTHQCKNQDAVLGYIRDKAPVEYSPMDHMDM